MSSALSHCPVTKCHSTPELWLALNFCFFSVGLAKLSLQGHLGKLLHSTQGIRPCIHGKKHRPRGWTLLFAFEFERSLYREYSLVFQARWSSPVPMHGSLPSLKGKKKQESPCQPLAKLYGVQGGGRGNCVQFHMTSGDPTTAHVT